MFDFLLKTKTSGGGNTLALCDVGGTKTRTAHVRGEELVDVHVEKTREHPMEGVARIAHLMQTSAWEGGLSAVVGCIAGHVGKEGVLSDARNLQQWQGIHIVEELRRALGVPVHLINDAQCVGLGEALMGAGKGAHTLVYITVSTGVGGARIVEGEIDFSAGDFAVGRIAVGDGDLESMISGTAVKKRFGVEPWDYASREGREVLADILAEGLKEVVGRWSPDTIVLGGSMMVGEKNTIPLDRVTHTLQGFLDTPHMPKLRLAALGDVGGLHGARLYARALSL